MKSFEDLVQENTELKLTLEIIKEQINDLKLSIYANPDDYKNSVIRLQTGQILSRNSLLYMLVDRLYSRTELEFSRGTFRVRGDSVDINIPYSEDGFRITFWGDEIEELERIEIESGKSIETLDSILYFLPISMLPKRIR